MQHARVAPGHRVREAGQERDTVHRVPAVAATAAADARGPAAGELGSTGALEMVARTVDEVSASGGVAVHLHVRGRGGGRGARDPWPSHDCLYHVVDIYLKTQQPGLDIYLRVYYDQLKLTSCMWSSPACARELVLVVVLANGWSGISGWRRAVEAASARHYYRNVL